MGDYVGWGKWDQIRPDHRAETQLAYGRLDCGSCNAPAMWMSLCSSFTYLATFLCPGCYKEMREKPMVVKTVCRVGYEMAQRYSERAWGGAVDECDARPLTVEQVALSLPQCNYDATLEGDVIYNFTDERD